MTADRNQNHAPGHGALVREDPDPEDDHGAVREADRVTDRVPVLVVDTRVTYHPLVAEEEAHRDT